MNRLVYFFASLIFLIAPLAVHGSAHETTPNVLFSVNSEPAIVNLIYKNGILNIKGLSGQGNITIYSIIGNEIAAYYNVNLVDFQRNIVLDSKTMFIIRVEVAGEIKTYKLVTR